jgi:hypothetical protein
MKLSFNLSRARVAGFTLVEIYTASAVLVLLVIAMTAVQFFAARVYTLAATKLTATASGRKVMNDIRDAIKASSSVQVGLYNPTNNTFSLIGAGTNQIGNALAIYPNNPNAVSIATIYFMNPQDSNMCSVVYSNNTVLTATLVTNIVVYITNYYVFDAEDAKTNIMTSNVNDRVIHAKFQYSEWEYPLAGVGGGALYDYYQLQTRATRRIMDY